MTTMTADDLADSISRGEKWKVIGCIGHDCEECQTRIAKDAPHRGTTQEADMSDLRTAAQQAQQAQTCTWHQDGDSDSGVYATSCRRYFNLEDGTPEDNKMQWCCYCGKKLVQELITEDDDE